MIAMVRTHRILYLFALSQRLYVGQRFYIAGRPLNGMRDVFQIILDPLRMGHNGSACCSTWSRKFIDRNAGVRTETRTPSKAPAWCSRRARVNKVVVSDGSTSRSRSLSSVSVPVRTDPKTRGRDRLWLLTSFRKADRWAAKASDGFMNRRLANAPRCFNDRHRS